MASERCADPGAIAGPSRSSNFVTSSSQQSGDSGSPPLTSRGVTSHIVHGEASTHEERTKQAAKVCSKAARLLHDLEEAVKRIPNEIPCATKDHHLSLFAIDPRICVAEPGEEDWPILNGMLKTAFGWGEIEMAAAIPEMLNRGELGLDGLIQFLTFFVTERGLEGALFETKIEALIKELDKW